jgi:hypothetical protein
MRSKLPDCLTKRGITRLETNLQPGYQVKAPMGRLFTLFSEEIMQACTTGLVKTREEGKES